MWQGKAAVYGEDALKLVRLNGIVITLPFRNNISISNTSIIAANEMYETIIPTENPANILD